VPAITHWQNNDLRQHDSRTTIARKAVPEGFSHGQTMTYVIAMRAGFPHTCQRFNTHKPTAIRGISHEHSYHSDSL